MTQKKKFLIMGLDKVGKTCIAQSLQGIKNLTAYTSSKPTRNHDTINFQALGLNYVILDFGGQEAYREKHLQDLKKHLIHTNKFIYVIDIQDIKRYQLALDYLKKIFEVIRKTGEKVLGFSIFLHKFDPDLEKFHGEINQSVINGLINHIKDIIPHDLECTISKTTIYTQFEKTNL